MPEEFHVTLDGKHLITVRRSGQVEFAKDFKWDEAPRALWEALIGQMSKEIQGLRELGSQLERGINERNDAISRLTEENLRLRALPNGPEDLTIEDRWTGIINEGEIEAHSKDS